MTLGWTSTRTTESTETTCFVRLPHYQWTRFVPETIFSSVYTPLVGAEGVLFLRVMDYLTTSILYPKKNIIYTKFIVGQTFLFVLKTFTVCCTKSDQLVIWILTKPHVGGVRQGSFFFISRKYFVSRFLSSYLKRRCTRNV